MCTFINYTGNKNYCILFTHLNMEYQEKFIPLKFYSDNGSFILL